MGSKKVTSKLGSIGKVSMCKRVLKHQTTESGEIPFYKISTFGGKADAFISKDLYDEFRDKYSFPKKGDILISAAGTIGETVIYDGKPAYFQDSNIVWIDNDETKILNNFLYYFYQTKPWLTTNGSTIKRIYNDNLRSIEITYPEALQDQQKIAAVLSALDAKIELNARINAELESMAKTLYDYWFVQFDFPNEKGKPYKSAGGKMVWNEKLKREIPLGWDSVTVGEILEKELKTKKIPNADILPCGKIPVIDQSADFIAGFTDDQESLIQVDEPKIIFGDHTRILKLINFDFARGADGTQVLLSKTNRLPQHLLYHTLLKIDLSNYGYARHFKFLKETRIILPGETVPHNFENIAKSYYNTIKHNVFENQVLTDLRDWLLPMLMNGQVKVG